jgi:two-component system nitrogen regulation response regulator NtrX
MASDILIVDDEADIRELISGILEDEGHGTRLAKDSDETLAAIEERRPSLVILDIWLQGSTISRSRSRPTASCSLSPARSKPRS